MPLPKSLTTVTRFSKFLALILFISLPFGGFYIGMQYQKSFSQQSSDQSTLFCKHWETICDPTYTDPNGGCAPKKICNDPSPTPLQSSLTQSPIVNANPSCTPYFPIGGTGSIPSNYIYPTLPPGGSYCPENKTIPPRLKACPMLAYKNSEGKTCIYTGSNCDLVCK